MGPLAGLAAGLGIAALASHLGFGDELASMVMFGLLAAAVMLAIGFFMRRRAAASQQAGSRNGAMQYASAMPSADKTGTPAYQTSLPSGGGGSMIGSSIGSNVAGGRRIPADFDAAGFARNAKVNFIRMQAASDAGDLDDIRQFTSPEMFAELKMDLAERRGAAQHNEVVTIEADVIDVEEGADRYVVSVRFTGAMREKGDTATEAFDEVWHLVKGRTGNTGWVVAGIQQMQ